MKGRTCRRRDLAAALECIRTLPSRNATLADKVRIGYLSWTSSEEEIDVFKEMTGVRANSADIRKYKDQLHLNVLRLETRSRKKRARRDAEDAGEEGTEADEPTIRSDAPAVAPVVEELEQPSTTQMILVGPDGEQTPFHQYIPAGNQLTQDGHRILKYSGRTGWRAYRR